MMKFSIYECRENRRSKNLALLGGVNKILSIISSIYFWFAYSSLENMSTRPYLSESGFRENRCSGRYTVHVGANVFLSVLSTFVVRFGWNSVEEIRTWCCWDFVGFMKIGAGKVILFLRIYTKLPACACCLTVWYLESKDHLGKFYALYNEEYLRSCYPLL